MKKENMKKFLTIMKQSQFRIMSKMKSKIQVKKTI